MNHHLKNLSHVLGYKFNQQKILEEALTHCSVRGTFKNFNYERLEFIGDRVLGLVVAEMLFSHFPKENEGALAKRHAALVQRDALARVAISIGLNNAIIMSKDVEENGGRQNLSILADSCEAVLGAIYIDGGFDSSVFVIKNYWKPLMIEYALPPKDAKTELQEWAQGLKKSLPVYQTLSMNGLQHDPTFMISVTVENHKPVIGSGTSKRIAEQVAATAMLKKIIKTNERL
ncbi:MAG: ribonuclease III [Rhodospirillaceae bacterium]|jgi:ribonuclease-3|nr:ribonuclease III [Rhodospirillaceae bacterium]